jgi:DNA-binding PadR family transcriptional regulator
MALSHAIMTALLDEELSGYDLTRRFETSLGFFWEASHQQIYRELRQLADRGWLSARTVAQEGRPDKITYALTDEGRQALADWVTGPTQLKRAKDDLFVKLYNVGFSDPAPVLAEIRERQQRHAERLALYEKIRDRHYARPSELPVKRKGIYLALAAGIRHERMYLDWCAEALNLLGDLDLAES